MVFYIDGIDYIVITTEYRYKNIPSFSVSVCDMLIEYGKYKVAENMRPLRKRSIHQKMRKKKYMYIHWMTT